MPRPLLLTVLLAAACSPPALTVQIAPALGGNLATSAAPHLLARAGPLARHAVWARRMGGAGDQAIREIAVDGAGNIAVLGTFDASADFGAGTLHDPAGVGDEGTFVVLLDEDGKTRWSRAFGGLGQFGSVHVAFDPEGAVVLAGSFSTPALDFGLGLLPRTSDADVFVAKLDATGRALWSRRFGVRDYQSVAGVAVDPAGNVVIVGSFVDSDIDFGLGPLRSAGGSDVFVAQLDPGGDPRWNRSFGGAASDEATAVGMDGGGNIVVAGNFAGTVDFGLGPLHSAGGTDVFVLRLDADGRPSWSRRFGSRDTDLVGGLAVDPAGGIALTGPIVGAIDFGVSLVSAGGTGYLTLLEPAGRVRWAHHTADWALPPPVFDGARNLFVVGVTHERGELYAAAYARAEAPLWRGPLGRVGAGTLAVAADRRSEAIVVAGDTSAPTIDLGTGALVGEDRDVFVARLSH